MTPKRNRFESNHKCLTYPCTFSSNIELQCYSDAWLRCIQMCSLCSLGWDLRTVTSMTRFSISQCNALHQFRVSIWGYEVEMMTRKNKSNMETIESVQHHWDILEFRHVSWSYDPQFHIRGALNTIHRSIFCGHIWSLANAMMPSHKHIICTFLQS